MSTESRAPVAPSAALHSATGGPGSILKTWWAAYTARRIERLAIARLTAMSDRELRDIGITRAQIAFAVKRSTDREHLVNRVLQAS